MTRINHQNMAEHFGWKFHPFADTWRMDQPFYSQRDQRIAEQGMQLLQHGKSFAVTGPSGAGKSTLVQHLLASLDANYYHGLHIHYGGLQRTALLKAVCEQLGVETNGRAVPLLVKLQKHIGMIATGKHPVHPVILVDDAQLLERESLMDLCSLIVCPPKKSAAASLIVVGDDLLAKQMTLAVMTPIRTRLTVNFRIDSLDEKETEQFIFFRLNCAQAPKDLFEPDALALVTAHCHGNRREIMNLGTLLLSEAFYRNEKTVSAQLFTDCDLIA
jgi:type II secretory pathway predicted ATPase ExeA